MNNGEFVKTEPYIEEDEWLQIYWSFIDFFDFFEERGTVCGDFDDAWRWVTGV